MEITKYLNSIDIARYLQSINYQFNSLEAAFIIWQSHKFSLKAKHAAWTELMKTMEDSLIPTRNGEKKSLFSLLKKYMVLQERMISLFQMDSENYMYHYRLLLTHSDNDWLEDDVYYRDYQSCLEAFRHAYDGGRFHVEMIRENIYGPRSDIMTLHLYEGKTIMNITGTDIGKRYEPLYQMFDGIWLNIPTPFVKGDIVTSPYGPYGDTFSFDNNKNPFVLTHICNWSNDKQYFDSMDMTAEGYFVNDVLYGECIHNYLDLEYYREPFTGKNRVLLALSNYTKGEIDIGLLLNAYHAIMSDEHMKSENSQHNYTEKGQNLAGIAFSKNTKSCYPNPYEKDPKPKYTVIE